MLACPLNLCPELNISYLLELKYVKAGMSPDNPRLPALIAAAREQVENYALDEKFKKTIGKNRLIKLVPIFSGHEGLSHKHFSGKINETITGAVNKLPAWHLNL